METRLIKNKLKEKAAEGDFADRKEKEQEGLDIIEKTKREIIFNLNRVAPENVKDIYREIENFALEDKQICNVLVESIIQKAWEQPKYAASYAKLSSYFAKLDPSKFKFQLNEKKNNFKYILIDKVQHSFDKKDKKENPIKEEDKEKFARDIKNLLIGNVKFIAELIKIKLIPKKTIKYCITQLLQFFFEGFYDYHKNKNTEYNFYEYYFEAIIEFLENLGEKYESIDEDKTEKADKGKKADKGEDEDKEEDAVAGN